MNSWENKALILFLFFLASGLSIITGIITARPRFVWVGGIAVFVMCGGLVGSYVARKEGSAQIRNPEVEKILAAIIACGLTVFSAYLVWLLCR